MKTIKILGTGCPKCKQTERIVHEAIKEIGIDVSVIKVVDIMEIMKYKVLSTPAVVVDEELVLSGKVPSLDEVIEVLK